MNSGLVACMLVGAVPASIANAELIADFEEANVGMLVETWTEDDIVFTSGGSGGLLTFLTHSPGHRGIMEALADVVFPVNAQFPVLATSVTVVFWGSSSEVATLQALDGDSLIVDQKIVPVPDVPIGHPALLFEVTVTAPEIASIRFFRSSPFGFLAADEVRVTPIPTPATALVFLGLLCPRFRRRRHDSTIAKVERNRS